MYSASFYQEIQPQAELASESKKKIKLSLKHANHVALLWLKFLEPFYQIISQYNPPPFLICHIILNNTWVSERPSSVECTNLAAEKYMNNRSHKIPCECKGFQNIEVEVQIDRKKMTVDGQTAHLGIVTVSYNPVHHTPPTTSILITCYQCEDIFNIHRICLK